jgi:hypothetical protein
MISQSYEKKRKRELLPVMQQLDTEMAGVVEEIRISRQSSGFVGYQGWPSRLQQKDAEVMELENKREVLIEKRNRALAEYAALV